MHVCPRCRRANPDVAVFCHFDGAELRPAHAVPAPQLPPGHLPHEFVFPSGRRCKTYDELVLACQEDWATACDLLRQGLFENFLASAGRTDLSRMARQARGQPDLDVALTTFLAGLPATRPRTPRLELRPRRLQVGPLNSGETRQVRLAIVNQGQGVLQGTLAITETNGPPDWLRLAEGPSHGPIAIKTSGEQPFLFHVDTSGMPAGQTFAAKLTVITNGGVVEIPVRLEVAAEPFPYPPFEGAGSPRDMSERMRRNPRAAVPLLEGGEVARWFRINGWNYPIQGPLAKGLGAIQQFFEAIGRSRPPAVQVSEPDVRMTPVPPEVVRWQVTLFTQERKWVYAQVDSDALWLKVLTPEISGPQRAAVSFEVDSSLLEQGRVYAGRVNITANAGQTLAVNVRVDVQGSSSFARRLFRPFLGSALISVAARLLLAPWWPGALPG